jgi:hypothetical protein
MASSPSLPRPSDSTLSLRTCLGIATCFWAYVSLTAITRWELARQAINDGGIAPPQLMVLTWGLMFVPLWLFSVVSWRVGYDLRRWRTLVAANLVLALSFGLCGRPALYLATLGLQDTLALPGVARMDWGTSWQRAELWASSTVENAAQYLVLQGILVGAAFYVRLKAEQALRARLTADFDRARLQLLRMQTNPHFLFNTLSAIAGLVRDRPEAAESMLTGLGSLFRATLLDRDADFVTLRRELDIGAQYLEIQRARFDSRFAFNIRVPPDAEEVLVPPLILQPLLENAAEHGLTSREGTIVVDVSCALTAGRVQVVVSNRADDTTRGKPAPSRGFGLENVRQRLRAAFGDAALFATEYTNAGLFEARMEFPLRS